MIKLIKLIKISQILINERKLKNMVDGLAWPESKVQALGSTRHASGWDNLFLYIFIFF